MELILKTTSKCNFACTFCSAGKLDIFHLDHVDSQFKDLLLKINPSSIILTGGDPLCNSPEFYNELLELGSWNLSFTTNLKDYILNPEKWIPLFKNKRVGVCTSFQFGSGRKWDNKTTYDVNKFKETFEKFLNDVGYRLKFISVISEENENQALEHIYLAQELNTKCKLNPLMPLGKSSDFFPMYKMIKIWLDIYQHNLQKWLDCDVQFSHGGCGFNTNLLCKSTIRALMFDKGKMPILTTCEDDLLKSQILDVPIVQNPEKEQIPISEHINSNCAFCKLFNLCHGCHQSRKLNKLVPEHCQEMKNLEKQILDVGWALQ